jgi:hypothetical protein
VLHLSHLNLATVYSGGTLCCHLHHLSRVTSESLKSRTLCCHLHHLSRVTSESLKPRTLCCHLHHLSHVTSESLKPRTLCCHLHHLSRVTSESLKPRTLCCHLHHHLSLRKPTDLTIDLAATFQLLYIFSPNGSTTPWGPRPPRFSRLHDHTLDTQHSVGLLCKSDQLVAETST